MDDDGVIQWLVYAVFVLVTGLMTLWNTHIGGRIGRTEQECKTNREDIHEIDSELKDKLDRKFTELNERLEARRLETKKDIRDLHMKLDKGHSDILTEIKNGRS